MEYLFDFHAQWTAVIALCVFFFCYDWVRPRFGASAASLLFLSAASALWVWTWKDNRYLSIDVYDQMALRYFACDSIAKIMLICVPLMLLAESRKTMLLLGEILGSLFVVGSALFSLWEARHGCGENRCGGLIGNPSISLGLSVSILPVFISSWRRQWWILALVGASVVASQSSIALGLAAVYTFIWLTPWRELRRGQGFGRLSLAAVSFLGVLGSARLALGHELTNDSDRFKIWAFMMDRWRAPWNIPFGTGLGTYHVMSVNVQQMHGGIARNSWWNTLHNEPLQILFECGIAGAALFLFTYVSALKKTLSEKDWRIALSIVLYGLYMTLDPALHNPLPALFGAWLFVYALRKEDFNAKLI